MAIPTKKIYGRNGKLIFDPNNPEDRKNYKEKQPLMEMFSLVQGLTDPRGGGGFTGMARKVSKAIAKETVKKVAKSATKRSPKKVINTESKVEKPNLTLENLKKALSPSSGLPGSLPKVTNTKSVSTTNKSLTSKSRTNKKTIPAIGESKSVIKTAAPKVRTLSDFMKQQSEVITPLLPDIKSLPFGSTKLPNISNVLKQQANTSKKTVNTLTRNIESPKTSNITKELAQIPGSTVKTIQKEVIKPFTGEAEKFVPKTNRLITRANSRAGNLKPFKGSTTQPGSTPMNYTPTDPSKALSVRELPEILSEYKPDKVPFTTAEKIKLGLLGTAFTGLLGGAAYQGYKSTKVGESKLDLNKINENDLRDSKVYKDVKIIRTPTGDKGIIKDPATGKWKYFDEKKGVRLPKSEVGLGDGPPIGLGDKTNTGNSGTSTKPRSASGQSFDKAFAEARKQAGGAGGIFEWNGKKYGTALVGETVPKDRVEVGKTTAPLMGDEYYKKDPSLATLRQKDDDKQLLARAEAQKKEMKEFKPTEPLDVLPVPTKPLSSLMFKTSTLNPKTGSRVEPVSYDTIDTKSKKLNKKRYGGNLTMLKYMK